MARSDRPPGDGDASEPLLFDLPLKPSRRRPGRVSRSDRPQAAPPGGEAAGLREPAPPRGLLLFDEDEKPAAVPTVEPGEGVSPEAVAATPRLATLGERLRAGLADLAVHAAVGLALLVGVEIMGARPGLADLPAVALFLLAFSFLYSVISLAFWGGTPGMLWTGLAARSAAGEGLTFIQTTRRWLGGLLTAALCGLPALLALTGRSLTDRLSASRTWRE